MRTYTGRGSALLAAGLLAAALPAGHAAEVERRLQPSEPAGPGYAPAPVLHGVPRGAVRSRRKAPRCKAALARSGRKRGARRHAKKANRSR